MEDALSAFGAPEEVREALLNQPEDEEDDFLIEKDNWNTLLVFLACQTQWKRDFVGMDGTLIWKGLDYPGIAVVIRMQGYRGQEAREIFEGLQVMEAAAIPILNKPKK